jgi:hypothetical protein
MKTHPLRSFWLAAAAIAVAVAAGCATTHIVSAWKDPAFANVAFRKVLVVFQHRDPGLRRVLENEMASDIPNAVPAHRIFRDEEIRDLELVKSRVRQEGFDSAVIMRVARVEREVSYVPGMVHWAPAYSRFWGYWGYGWGLVYDPGYLRTDRIVNVVTHVYSIADDKLVWASQSETFNPTSLREAISEVVRVTAKATGDALKTKLGSG